MALLQREFSLNSTVFTTALEILLLEAGGGRRCGSSMMHFCLPECHYSKRIIPISRSHEFIEANLFAQVDEGAVLIINDCFGSLLPPWGYNRDACREELPRRTWEKGLFFPGHP